MVAKYDKSLKENKSPTIKNILIYIRIISAFWFDSININTGTIKFFDKIYIQETVMKTKILVCWQTTNDGVFNNF